MATAANETALPPIVDPRSLRTARLLRSGALLLTGLGIAFTAPLHEQLEFDRWAIFVGLLIIGCVTFVEYRVLRFTLESWWIAARAIIAFAAVGALLAVSDSVGIALVVAAWAALTAVVTILRLVRGAQPKQVAIPSALLSVALAVISLLVMGDAVALIGFFGAYAVIRGVFLGISAFDGGAAAHTAPAAASPEIDPSTESES